MEPPGNRLLLLAARSRAGRPTNQRRLKVRPDTARPWTNRLPRGAVTGVLLLVAMAPPPVASVDGLASFYGSKFHGRRTASGERFDQHAMTAAHQTLGFGTRVRVTHGHNGRSVVVTINDRGPFVRGRIIDLSRAAAHRLGMLRAGVAPVRLQVLGRGPRGKAAPARGAGLLDELF